ncbi:hypothetical protein TNCV_3547151 [Trichonephila clavipes]|nr:hypothetical protein TNCV_3547151 [Trichonephila clavipes]
MEYNINSKYAKLDNFLISASSSSCASASSSNARELDEQGPPLRKRNYFSNNPIETLNLSDIAHIPPYLKKDNSVLDSNPILVWSSAAFSNALLSIQTLS